MEEKLGFPYFLKWTKVSVSNTLSGIHCARVCITEYGHIWSRAEAVPGVLG